jgi:hypothetical protein
MTTTTHDRTASAASDAYLAAVGAALVGVADSDRQELLDDLAEHLAELAHETDAGLIERLGPPEQYAAELLASAGIEPGARRGSARRRVVERARAAKAYLDKPWPQRLRAFWRDLLPGWWVVRAWLVLAALAARSGLQEALWLPNLTGSTFVDTGLLAGAIVVSVRIGRGPKWPAYIATAIGVLALFSVLTANRSYFYRFADQQQVTNPSALIDPNGNYVTNIFPFDGSGKPISGIYLSDQYGQPLDVGNSQALQYNGVTFVPGVFPQPEVVTNELGRTRVVQPKPPRFSVPRLPQLYAPKSAKTTTTAKPSVKAGSTPTTAAR